MHRYFIVILLIFLHNNSALARHIKGGFIRYEYLGAGTASGTSSYRITVSLFASCTETGPVAQVYLGVFDAVTNSSVLSRVVTQSSVTTASKTSYDPCLSSPPTICYRIYGYVTTVELNNNQNGYTLTVQDALRSAGIVNMVNSGGAGITFTASIPGAISSVDYHSNTSPVFDFKDTAIICYNAPFQYQFSASDADGDSLSYYLGPGLDVANAGGNTASNPPASPPYASINYASGYSAALPMGTGVNISPVSGLISGTAPSTTGEYVIAVYVQEWRNGVLLATTKKELQVAVANCSLTAASLKTSYINCDDFSFTFQNESSASNINSYYWDFGVPNISTDVSSIPVPKYTYPDTGTFRLKLKVTTSGGCADSTESPVKVYPGFSPDFTVNGSCYASPFYFTDATLVRYGTVSSWAWDFGDLSGTADVSDTPNPSYQYPNEGDRTVTLVVTSSKGCVDTVSKTVAVNTRPSLYLPFHDTLICSIDTLPLIAVTDAGSVSWLPATNILYSNTSNPLVFPKDTVTYTITVAEKGCVNSDSIRVNVLDFITVEAGRDTAICRGDSIQFHPVTEALSFAWSPDTGLSGATAKQPMAAPTNTTTYQITANLGKCQDKDTFTVFVSPYPVANAGSDTSICYGSMARLNGSITGTYFTWSPTATLTNITSLEPTARPLASTTYVLTVTDTFYCPKPVTDSVLVTVIPKVEVNAGRDTSVTLNQPLQLHATGAPSYEWSPTEFMNNSNTASPVVTVSGFVDSIRYYVTGSTPEGCSGTDDVLVKVFTTGPDIFVPSGFTPNSDGKNDVLKPILVGMQSLEYFRVFNRYGQVVFQTLLAEKGWDGRINGEPQPTGAFVYIASGLDYTGRRINKKGKVVLVR